MWTAILARIEHRLGCPKSLCGLYAVPYRVQTFPQGDFMLDLIFLAALAVLFVLTLALIGLCDRLLHRGDRS